MSLKDWLDNGWLKQHQTARQNNGLFFNFHIANWKMLIY
jgi:hypothetical protein